MADKGDHPGIHIDPTDFYKDVRKEDMNKGTEKDKNLQKEMDKNMDKDKTNMQAENKKPDIKKDQDKNQ